MQDGCRILGNGKSGKMAKKYQHHKFSQAWGKDEENLTHFFRHYQKISFGELLNDFSLLLNKRNSGFSEENSSDLQ